MAMEEVTSDMTIAIIMIHLVCHEVQYLWRTTKSDKFRFWSAHTPSRESSCHRSTFLIIETIDHGAKSIGERYSRLTRDQSIRRNNSGNGFVCHFWASKSKFRRKKCSTIAKSFLFVYLSTMKGVLMWKGQTIINAGLLPTTTFIAFIVTSNYLLRLTP